MIAAVNLHDPATVRAWVELLRTLVLDGFAAGEDAARPPSKRVLSPAEARRRMRAAEREIVGLLDGAIAGTKPRLVLVPRPQDCANDTQAAPSAEERPR